MLSCPTELITSSEQADLEHQDAEQVGDHSDAGNNEQEVRELGPAGTSTTERVAQQAVSYTHSHVLVETLQAEHHGRLLFIAVQHASVSQLETPVKQ